MSATPNDGGLAFPSHGSMGEIVQHGMSLRDWFSGQALASMTIAPDYSNAAMAKRAFAIADAMLKVRNSTP